MGAHVLKASSSAAEMLRVSLKRSLGERGGGMGLGGHKSGIPEGPSLPPGAGSQVEGGRDSPVAPLCAKKAKNQAHPRCLVTHQGQSVASATLPTPQLAKIRRRSETRCGVPP